MAGLSNWSMNRAISQRTEQELVPDVLDASVTPSRSRQRQDARSPSVARSQTLS